MNLRTGLPILASLSLLLSACISTSFQPAQNFDAPGLTPTSPEAVRVLRSPPHEPFLTLGDIVLEITGYHSSEAIIRKARERAAAIGADTIILTSALSGASAAGTSEEGTVDFGASSHLALVVFTATRRLPEGSSQGNE